MSQKAGRIFLEQQGHTNLQFETDGRVDIIAESPAGQILRIELKLISMIMEAKERVFKAIRTTKNRLKPKRLTHLLILTLLRKTETDDERFIKVKEYCLLGIFVSKSELEKKDEKELVREIGEKVDAHLDDDFELISISREEFLRNWEREERREELVEELQKTVVELSEEVRRLDQTILEEVKKIDHKLDQKVTDEVGKLDQKVTDEVRKLDQKVTDEVRKLDQKLSDNQKQLEDILKLLTKHFKK